MIHLIHSYLTNRNFILSNQKVNSNYIFLSFLFNIFINDILQPSETYLGLYADDTAFF